MGVAAVVVGVLGWGLYRYMDNVLMLASLMKAQHEVMTVMVLRANNMACTWYGWVSHRALLRSFPFATVMKLPEQKWSSIYFVNLSNITWILQAFCTLLGTWPVSWTGPALVLPGWTTRWL